MVLGGERTGWGLCFRKTPPLRGKTRGWESLGEAETGPWTGEDEGQTGAEMGIRDGCERRDLRDFLEVDLTEQGDCLALRVDGSGVQARAQSPAWGDVEGETAPEMGLEKNGKPGGIC